MTRGPREHARVPPASRRSRGASLAPVNVIIAEVVRRRRVSFAEFMELALYPPKAGYYTQRRTGEGPAGRSGDFLTAPTASPIFGRTLAELGRQPAGHPRGA